MSDQMLLAILRMPYPDADKILLTQFIDAARDAADKIEQLQRRNASHVRQAYTMRDHMQAVIADLERQLDEQDDLWPSDGRRRG